jgi:hypothetical protein
MHARRLFPVFSVPGLIAAGLLSGCIITAGSGGSGSHSTTGSDGDGGYGGYGGEADTTSGGSGGSGGGESCVGSEGKGFAADCDDLNIAPNRGAPKVCPPPENLTPLGYGACVHAYAIYTNGSADEFRECLATIGVEDTCTDSLVKDCVDKMYADACEDDTVVDNCNILAAGCTGSEPFDKVRCNEDLRPLNDEGLKQLQECYASNDQVPCQTAYTDCYDKLLDY